MTCRSVTTPFSSAFSASSAVARFLRAFQYAFSSRKYWKTPGKSPVFAFKGKEVIVSLARSYDAKMTTFRSQKAHKTSKMDSPGPPLRSPRPLRFHVHLRPSAAHLPNTFQCAALSAHPPLRSLRLCERRSWPPSLRPLRSPRFPFHLFPTRLGFSRAQTTPKSQLFGGLPLFLGIVVPQSWAALTELPLAPLASWRENRNPGKTATSCAPLSQGATAKQ